MTSRIHSPSFLVFFLTGWVAVSGCGRNPDKAPPERAPSGTLPTIVPDTLFASPATTTAKAAANSGAPDAPGPSVDSEETAKNIDTIMSMLAEIDAAWQKNQMTIFMPSDRPGFRVVADHGVPFIVPNRPVPMAALLRRLQQRKQPNNKDLHIYTDQSLNVPIYPSTGTVVPKDLAPHVFALNETLLVFVTPRSDDNSIVHDVTTAVP